MNPASWRPSPTTTNSGFVLADATKDSLKALPEYKYTE